MTFKITISQFCGSSNGNETKPDIFSWDILKSDIVFQWPKNNKIFQ